jgi:hypothetical protein
LLVDGWSWLTAVDNLVLLYRLCCLLLLNKSWWLGSRLLLSWDYCRLRNWRYKTTRSYISWRIDFTCLLHKLSLGGFLILLRLLALYRLLRLILRTWDRPIALLLGLLCKGTMPINVSSVHLVYLRMLSHLWAIFSYLLLWRYLELPLLHLCVLLSRLLIVPILVKLFSL